jgi:hypothetical protein
VQLKCVESKHKNRILAMKLFIDLYQSIIEITVVFKENIFIQSIYLLTSANCIGGVMAIVLGSGAVDLGFEYRSGQTKDNNL